jgi:asparagine synthase (glutamine-hydrolysing)
MCGLAGCIFEHPLTDKEIEAARAITKKLHHRGPDDSGEILRAEHGFYAGHQRLAIIDIDKRSAQPMEREGLILSYNGEIYNYRELRKQLETEFTFTTESDTEVLLYAWRKWGPACLERLDGMFAFMLKDGAGTHLVTDPFGEKPLYLYKAEKGYYFASEAPALIEVLELPSKINCYDHNVFLNLGFLQAPDTGYPGLTVLPPAAHFTITLDGVLRQRTYWSLPEINIEQGRVKDFDETTLNTIRDHLCYSLEKRLRADVPVGLFLSSGIDSALVASLAKCELGIDLETYTVNFNDDGFKNESRSAQKIAEHLRIPHRIIESEEDTLWQDTPKNLKSFFGTPIDNPTVFSLYQMCKVAKPLLSVALTGVGGDEIFYGYNKYAMFYQNRLLHKYSGVCEKLCKFIPHSKFKIAHDLLKGSKAQQFLRSKNGPAQSSLPTIDDFGFKENQDIFYAARHFDFTNTLPYNQIPAFDRGSMRASLELRTPYLYRPLLEYCSSLDQRAFLHFGKKAVPKKLLKRYLPQDLINRGKQGFVTPLQRYFDTIQKGEFDKDEHRTEIRRLILNSYAH